MSDQTSILAALVTLIETRLGADSIIPEPMGFDEVLAPAGVLVAQDYLNTALPFRQSLITYPFIMLFKRSLGTDDMQTARDGLYDDCELIRADLIADSTLSGVARDSMVTNILVQSHKGGVEVRALMNFDVIVLRS
jgi:hypothetical protein